MSELVRENWRRYQLDEAERRLLADPRRVELLSELKQAVADLRREAAAAGTNKLKGRKMNAIVTAARRDRKKHGSRAR
jgi:hypothetical protein